MGGWDRASSVFTIIIQICSIKPYNLVILEGSCQMKSLWSITVEDYEEVVRRAKEVGLNPGDSMEAIFVQYMNEKGQKPCANTELTKAELISEYTSHDKNILDISTDDKGKQVMKIHKKEENNSL
jgi:hypothetical protein